MSNTSQLGGRLSLISACLGKIERITGSYTELIPVRDALKDLLTDAHVETARLDAQVEILTRVNTELNTLCTTLRAQNTELRERWATDVAKRVAETQP